MAGVIACGGAQHTPPLPPPRAIEVRAAAPTPRPPVPLHKLRPGQFRVCAFSFNSPHELAVFKAELSPQDFDIVDLTPTQGAGQEPLSSPNPGAPSSPGWLMNQCRPDLRCDIVVFSGEFAGGFFGNYGTTLNLQEIEEASCQWRCQGLFHYPREAFLLACNTLATKGADNRTPREYLHVLLGHGFSQADAERVVDLRYGPLGPSFAESLRRSFMGVPRVYGFSSVAPRGEVTASHLQQYFKRTGDYARYLTRAERDSKPNTALLTSFAETSLKQTTGLTPLEPAAADRTLVCNVYDDTRTVSDRLGIVRRLFARPDFLAFVPTIEVFLNRHPPQQLRGAERRLFAEIQSLQAPRRQMVNLMYSLNVSALKMQMAHLALQLAWIGPNEYRRLAMEGARQLLTEPLSTEVVDIACELVKYAPAGTGLRAEDFSEEAFSHSEGFRLIDCLSPADPRLTTRMLVGLEDIDESTRLWATYALSRRPALDATVLTALARRLNDPSPAVRDRLQRTLREHAPLPPTVLAAVRERDPALARSLDPRVQQAK